MKRSEEYEKRDKTFAKVNKLLDIIAQHIENEDCQHCRDYLREGWEARNE
jgi:hypothetical protein